MISVVVLTKNEEKNIVDCLESLAWCDEIIIIDDYSEDKTLEIIQNSKFKIQNYNSKFKIYKRHLNGDFSTQRNFGLEKVSGDWVLFVDADERVPEALASEISNFIHSTSSGQISNKYNGFYIKRGDSMWGKELKHGETGDIWLLRLAKKDSGKWKGKVHEEWKIKGRIDALKNHLDHYPHPTISEFLSDINFYTNLKANELFEKGVRSDFISILLYPTAKFLSNYFLKLGFLDGLHGLVFAIMMSFHSFLVRGKLWHLWSRLEKF